jgi:hypothetical protein
MRVEPEMHRSSCELVDAPGMTRRNRRSSLPGVQKQKELCELDQPTAIGP